MPGLRILIPLNVEERLVASKSTGVEFEFVSVQFGLGRKSWVGTGGLLCQQRYMPE